MYQQSNVDELFKLKYKKLQKELYLWNLRMAGRKKKKYKI